MQLFPANILICVDAHQPFLTCQQHKKVTDWMAGLLAVRRHWGCCQGEEVEQGAEFLGHFEWRKPSRRMGFGLFEVHLKSILPHALYTLKVLLIVVIIPAVPPLIRV